MKNYLKVVLLFCCISLTIQCVSTKKYHASENRVKELQADSLKCQQDMRKLTAEKLGIESEKAVTEQSLTQQLIIKQEELRAKESLLNNREQRLKQLERIINNQNQSINNLQASISKALIGFKPEELSVSVVDGKVYVSMQEQLLFKSASAKVDPKGLEALGKLAQVLNANSDIDIIIEGHTDSIPISKKYDDNWDLSVNRAISIARILQRNYKVNPERLIATGRGEYFPVDVNSTAEGRQHNRRTEIILYPKLDELYNLVNKK